MTIFKMDKIMRIFVQKNKMQPFCIHLYQSAEPFYVYNHGYLFYCSVFLFKLTYFINQFPILAQSSQIKKKSSQTRTQMSFFTPTMSSKYKLISQIGEGSFGCVYLVKDEKQRYFALKKIHVDPFQIDQALKEIQIMKKFVHPNLIKIYDSQFDESNQTLEIVMQYCEKGDLFNYYKKKKTIQVKEILKIFKQIVQAFVVMNLKGVIHRDLKPQNILLGKGSLIKIADFGCARNVNKQSILQADNFSLGKGTPIYASPEQLIGEKYSAKCDVWSAGCLLQHPFMDKRVHNTLLLIKRRTEGKEIELDKGTESKIAKIIQLTLIYDQRQRSSWRQLSLCRLFQKELTNIRQFVEYLKNISTISNWMAKQFWKCRKNLKMQRHKDQLFVYFLIKFQSTSIKTALQILQKDPRHLYLFEQAYYNAFQPTPQFVQNMRQTYTNQENYYASINKSMETKDVYKLIKQKEALRVSCFSDLDNSIRACYKILREVEKQIKCNQDNMKVWVCMSKWINFQRNFSFQNNPRVEKIIASQIENIQKLISNELDIYEQGIID